MLTETRHKGLQTAIVSKAHADIVANALLGGSNCTPVEGSAFGRGVIQVFDLPDGQGILREHRRGGFIRHFLKRAYLFHNRPLQEWQIHTELHDDGLPVPEPLGVMYERRGFVYQGAIATRRIAAPSLIEWLDGKPDSTDDTLYTVGETIARLHDHGVFHADLNGGNILIAPDGPVILDFDKARRLMPLTAARRKANLDRLQRSLAKHGLAQHHDAILLGYRGGFVHESVNGDWLWRRREVTADNIVSALNEPGETLKESRKAVTRRVGEWVIKESPRGFWNAIKYYLQRRKFRRLLEVAQFLQRNGVEVPPPVAYYERQHEFYAAGFAYITEYLHDYVTVEEYARRLVRENASHDAISGYLARMAEAINRLDQLNARHADLSGKNILTRDGNQFVFVDLDAVSLYTPYDQDRRMTALVQLQDSFCDYWGDDLLEPFITALMPRPGSPPGEYAEVKNRQTDRRARIEATWAKEGKLPPAHRR